LSFLDSIQEPEHLDIGNIVKVISHYPQMVNEEDNVQMMKEISFEELMFVMNSFQKEKILGPDKWPIEFFNDFFDVIGEDLMCMIEEVRKSGDVPISLN
jgi:hypothetical protein